MRRAPILPGLLAPLALWAALAGCAAPRAPGATSELPPGRTIGAPLEPQPVVRLAEVLASPERYGERTLLIRGRVGAVCKMQGCWMQIEDGAPGQEPVRALVRWEEGCGGAYAFPPDLLGREVVLQGSIYARSVGADEAEHLAEESGKDLALADRAYEINVSAVRMLALAPSRG